MTARKFIKTSSKKNFRRGHGLFFTPPVHRLFNDSRLFYPALRRKGRENYQKILFKMFHVEHFNVDAAAIDVRSIFCRESFMVEFFSTKKRLSRALKVAGKAFLFLFVV